MHVRCVLNGAVVPLGALFCGADATDVGAERAQFFLDGVVAPVEVVDAVNSALAFSGQGGEDKAGTGAQVGRHHRCATQFFHAVHGGGVAASCVMISTISSFVTPCSFAVAI